MEVQYLIKSYVHITNFYINSIHLNVSILFLIYFNNIDSAHNLFSLLFYCT